MCIARAAFLCRRSAVALRGFFDDALGAGDRHAFQPGVAVEAVEPVELLEDFGGFALCDEHLGIGDEHQRGRVRPEAHLEPVGELLCGLLFCLDAVRRSLHDVNQGLIDLLCHAVPSSGVRTCQLYNIYAKKSRTDSPCSWDYNKLMNKRLFLIGWRLLFAALNILAIVMQLLYTAQYSATFSLVNFFSYFTILGNVFVSVVFIMSAWYVAVGRKPTPTDDIMRGASVLYMIIVGLVYGTLLADKDVGLTLPWVNIQLHYVMPLVVVLDWLYQPQRSKLKAKQTFAWLIFPFLYVTYTLIRGAATGWYPYPFLNPAQVGGYGGVLGYSVGILVALGVASLLLMALGNRLKRRVIV